MMRGFLIFVAFMLPLVSSAQDVSSCVENIVTTVVQSEALNYVTTFIDLAQCVVDGTVGGCQFGCMVDSNCVGAGDVNQCVSDCSSQCDDPTFLNSECLAYGVDLLEDVPYFQYLATLYAVFSTCVVDYGWAVQSVYNAATSPDPDVFEAFCETLQAYVIWTNLGCSNIQNSPNTIATAIAVAVASATAEATAYVTGSDIVVSGTTTEYSTSYYGWIQSGSGTAFAVASVTVYATAIATASLDDTVAYASSTVSASMIAYVTATAPN
jgi:hypothetical protein